MEIEDIKPKKYIPRFVVKTTKGETLTFGDGSDKPTLLVLFTTWCSSCQQAAPIISREFAQYKDKMNLIGIGREHNSDELEKWANEVGLEYDLVEDPNRELFHHFAKMHVPRMYLIDTKGKVHYQDVNWHPFMLDDMAQSIKKLLKIK